MRIRGPVLGLLAGVVLLSSCSDAGDGEAASDSPSGAVQDSSAGAPASPDAALPSPATALPAGEPVPRLEPDPRAGEHLTRLQDVPDGELVGSVVMAVPGRVSLAEPVTGRCATTATGRSFAMELADGSVLEVSFGDGGGSARFTAPGLDAGHALADVSLETAPEVRLQAGVSTERVAVPTGRLELTGTCG